MTVADWPSYILRGVPPRTRGLMTARAADDDCSLADVIRQALCHRYQLDCDPASFGYQPQLDTNGSDILVRVQPDVWKLLKREAGVTRTTTARYGATKRLILEALTDYLEVTQ